MDPVHRAFVALFALFLFALALIIAFPWLAGK